MRSLSVSNSALVLIVVLHASIASAQFQLDIVQLASLTPPIEDHLLVEKPAQAGNQLFAVRQNIDAMMFNEHGNALRAKKNLTRQLKARIQGFADSFRLTDEQIRKLRIAGTGDITAFFAEFEVLRSEFDEQVNQADWGKLWQRVQPLQMRMQRGLFSNGSMLEKVLKRTLDKKQLQAYKQKERERIDFGYRAAIKLTIAELEKSTPLMQKQRNQIVELLGKSERPKVLGQYVNYYVLFRLSQSKQQLNEFLKPGQRKAWTQALNQGQGMGQFLKQNGFID